MTRPHDDGDREAPPGASPSEPPPSDTLPLSAALQLAGFAETGGQAKRMIQAGDVRVNGEVETRRKRRLVPGDAIEVGDQAFVLELEDAPDDDVPADGPAPTGDAT